MTARASATWAISPTRSFWPLPATRGASLRARSRAPRSAAAITGIRNGHTHLAQIDGVKIYTTVNRNEAGEIAELFVTTDREGTTIMGLLNSLSKTISVMLQYGIPAERISKMLRGRCMSPTGSCRAIPTSST